MTTHRSILPLAFVLALTCAPAAHANEFAFHLDLNVASLTLAPNQPYYLDFQLNEGSGSLPNTAVIKNFSFLGGAPTGTANGNGTGSLLTSVTLNANTGSPFNEFWQSFSATTTDIQFDVFLTANSPGATPDGFVLSILDSSSPGLPQIFTNAPDTASLVIVPIGLSNGITNVQTYASTSPSGVTVTASVVPDTGSTMALFGGAGSLCSLFALRRRRVA